MVTPAAIHCDPVPFAASTPVPEASGAAWTEFRGKPALFVISDSGNQGAYGIVDPDSGDTLAQGKLENGGHGDDYEGVAAWRGKIWAVASNGYAGAITRDGESFHLGTLSPLGSVIANADEPKGHGTHPPGGTGMVCEGHHDGNCGRNFEGICLDDRPAAHGPCVGFGAAKAEGKLYCLVEHDGVLTAAIQRSIEVMKPGQLADCAIDETGVLWAGGNIFSANDVVRVEGWDDPAHARVSELGPVGIGNSEVIAVRGDIMYRMSDTNGAPSLMAKFRCTAGTR